MKSVLLPSVCLFVSSVLMAQPPQPPEPLPDVTYPPENPFSESRRVLGKILFWDEQLSSDDTVACGTCHMPGSGGADSRTGHHPGVDGTFGTADDIVGSAGIVRYDAQLHPVEDDLFGYGPQVTGRASPSMLLAMYAENLFWDGRAGDEFIDPVSGQTIISSGGALETQSLMPILSTVEMSAPDRTWQDVTDKLAQVDPLALASDWPADIANALAGGESYPQLFAHAYGDEAITPARIAMAIATYERTLVPDQTPWDRFIQGNNTAMTGAQRAGWDLFRDSECIGCHRPPVFSTDGFFTIGLRPIAEDEGRRAVTGLPADRGAFRTPSLRNIGLRRSLMHVGWVTGIEDALDFYNAGTNDTGHFIFAGNLSGLRGPGFDESGLRIDDIDFVAQDSSSREQVVDFLANALTDPRVAAESFPFDRPLLASERRELSLEGQMLVEDLLNSDFVQSAAYDTDATTVAALFTSNGLASNARVFSSDDRVGISTLLDIADNDVGRPASIYIVAYYNGNAFMRNRAGGYQRWSEDVADLQPFMSRESLSSSETVPLVDGLRNMPGQFSVYLAYQTADRIVFTASPISFEITAAQ